MTTDQNAPDGAALGRAVERTARQLDGVEQSSSYCGSSPKGGHRATRGPS